MQSMETEKLPEKGDYTLVIFLHSKISLKAMRRRSLTLEKGYYAYTGSALGKGATGLRRRVERHLRRLKNRHWHIDHLLANDKSEVVAVIAAGTRSHQECKINQLIQTIRGTTIPIIGFGSSDCMQRCKSHLVYSYKRNVKDQIAQVYSGLFDHDSVTCLTLNYPAILEEIQETEPNCR